MKKKWLYFIFVFLCFFFMNEEVNAKMDTSTVEIECIYSTGVAVNLSYDSTNGSLAASIKEYPVSKSSIISGETFANISLFDGSDAPSIYESVAPYLKDFNVAPLKDLTCPDHIKVWRVAVSEKEETGDWKTTIKGIYSFKDNIAEYLNYGDKYYITDWYGGTGGRSNNTSWWIFGDNSTSKTKVIPINATNILCTDDDPDDDDHCGSAKGNGYNHIAVPLVAERLYIVGDLVEDDYSVAYKSSATEAIGSSTYVQFLKRKNSNGKTVYYAQRGKTMTSIEFNGRNNIGDTHICFKESISEQDSSRTDSSYKFNISKHKVAAAGGVNGQICPAGYVSYALTDEVCSIDPEDNADAESFCDVYGNTAKVIIDIVNIAQIFIPALVIVLTGIDIGKIVIAGNIEEELPKKKKSIIVRLIVMLTFFFLPLIIEVVVDLLVDKEIYDVSCLFNNGVNEKESELECKSIDDESGD